jgi:hypothetical protein
LSHVAQLLQEDIGRVTEAKPELLLDEIPPEIEIVLIGTLGHSPVIDRLAEAKKLDATDLAGQREMFVLQKIRNPQPGVERALVIAGGDKRGTMYGMLDLRSHRHFTLVLVGGCAGTAAARSNRCTGTPYLGRAGYHLPRYLHQ